MKKGGDVLRHTSRSASLRSRLTHMKRKLMRRGLPPRAQRSIRNTVRHMQRQINSFFCSIGRTLRKK